MGESIDVLEGHTHDIYGLAISADSQLLVSTGEDQTVRLWDLQSRRNLKILRGYTGGVSFPSLEYRQFEMLVSSWSDRNDSVVAFATRWQFVIVSPLQNVPQPGTSDFII
ncbi:WD40 repeat domain-containing protein [Tolypothrix bouteillei VB521301_2]|uniref:WD40 repeat domain-containing protein n=1 Tax=Tolypothrix bouteillei TaxID=1246981 RepID=UPI0038B42753